MEEKALERPYMNANSERRGYYRIEVAAELVGMRPVQIRHCLRSGLVSPSAEEHGVPMLGEAELARLRKIRRLTTDVGLNRAGVEVVLRLLDEIEALRAEVRRAQRENHPR